MQPATLITGASRGLGRAFAERIAQKRRPLVLAARSAADLDALAEGLRAQHGIDVACIPCDLSTQAGVDALCAATAERSIDCVINNAGVGMGGLFSAQPCEQLAAMLFLNTSALTQVAHRHLPHLRATRGGLLNVSSVAAFQPMPRLAAYAATKAYVLQLSCALHHELRPDGVRVTALCPPATATDFFARAGIDVRQTKLRLGPIDQVVDTGLAALARGDMQAVPGLGAQALAMFAPLLGRRLAARISDSLLQPPGGAAR